MTLMLVLLVLLPWSIWRQMHEHEVTREGLVSLPLIFAAIGVLGFGTGAIPTDAAALGYIAFSLSLSVFFGVWRGVKLSVWRNADGNPMSIGNRTTITLWGVLIGSKFALGAIASITGWFPAESRRRGLHLPRAVVRRPEPRRRPARRPLGRRPVARPGRGGGMRLRVLLAAVAATGAAALAAAPAQAQAQAAPLACPGTFSVLHDDTHRVRGGAQGQLPDHHARRVRAELRVGDRRVRAVPAGLRREAPVAVAAQRR